MGSGGTEWEDNDVGTAARMNQKTIYVGASEPATMYAGMQWNDTSTTPFITIRIRNADNNAWNTLQELLGLETTLP
jgi:hypothetical protein